MNEDKINEDMNKWRYEQMKVRINEGTSKWRYE